jgi:hypothetical protein
MPLGFLLDHGALAPAMAVEQRVGQLADAVLRRSG